MHPDILYYMRKSISDALVRVPASKELLDACTKFDETIRAAQEPWRCIGSSPVLMLCDGFGSEGMVVTVDTSTMKIVNLALRSRATCDKQGNYFNGIVNSIQCLRNRRGLSKTEFVELVLLASSLSSHYALVTILRKMQSPRYWDRKKTLALPGGLFEFGVLKLREHWGSISGGPCPRFQVSLTKGPTYGQVRKSCNFVLGLMGEFGFGGKKRKHSPRQPPSSDHAKREEVTDVIYRTSQNCHQVGILKAQHLKDCIAQCGFAPSYFLEYGVIPHKINQHEQGKRPSLDNYLLQGAEYNASGARKGGKATDKRRLAVVLGSVTRAARVQLDQPFLTESAVENMICESSRGMNVYDLWYPGDPLARRVDPTPRLGGHFAECDSKWAQSYPWKEPGAIDVGDIQFTEKPIVPLSFGGVPLDEMNSVASIESTSLLWRPVFEDTPGLNERIEIGLLSDQGPPSEWKTMIVDGKTIEGHCHGLTNRIKLSLVPSTPSNMPTHEEFMETLNSIPELQSLVHQLATPKSTLKLPTGSSARSKKMGRNKNGRGEKEALGAEMMSTRATMTVVCSTAKVPGKVVRLPETGWSKCTFRVEDNVTYKLFDDAGQLNDTILESFLGYTHQGDFSATPRAVAPVLHNDASSALKGAVPEDIAGQVKMCNIKVNNGRRKGSMGGANVKVIVAEREDDVTLFTAECTIIPRLKLNVIGACRMRDSIARCLGGIRFDGMWYFACKDAAVDYVLFCIVFLCGGDHLARAFSKRIAKLHCSEDGKTREGVLAGQFVRASDSTTLYYLIGSWDAGQEKPRYLAMGIPSKAGGGTARKRTGKISGKSFMDAKKVMFVRLM